MRTITIALLVLTCAGAAVAGPRARQPQTSCRVYFMAVEQDETTVNLRMVGLNSKQGDWYRKDGQRKEYAGICVANATASDEQVPLESGSESHVEAIVASASLYLIAWEEHRVYVPDTNGGHYAFSANGTLSVWDRTAQNGQGDFVPIGPIHATNRTIFSSSSVSLLKAALKEIGNRSR
jgi:hypothetical protein